jgi:bacteriochlorophyllide a dehydrogenase
MHTHAIVITQPDTIELREVALTAPGAADLVIQTAYTSISAGTERMLLAGRMPHPMLSLPVIPGYETVGRVVAAGVDAPQELVGQWVYAGGARCYVDVNPAWGGQAATIHVDHQRAVPLTGVEPSQGVLLALAATAHHGVDLLGSDLGGRRVLVLGQGPVGQLAGRIARGRGAWVAATDRNAMRLARTQADVVIDTSDRALTAQLDASVDTIIEATGSMEALAAALPLLANGGTIVLLGYYDELRLPYMPLFLKQARLLTAREWAPGDPARCRDLIAAGALHVADLITHRLPVAEAAHAYDLALNDRDCLKLLLEW